MNKRQMGKDGPLVPVVCFGTWPLGGAYGDLEEQKAITTMETAMDAGLTFIDTAEGYMNAESIIGKSIKGRRNQLFIATKVSNNDHSTKHINTALHQSLTKMNIDHVDLYQLHSSTSRPVEDTMEDLIRLRDAGKIRYFGISNFSPVQIDEISKVGHISSGQPRYNMLFREVERDILPAYLRNGIGVMAHSVLAKGLLGGRYKPGDSFEKNDERFSWPHFKGDLFKQIHEVTERLKAWSMDQGRDIVQLAISWPLGHPSVYTSIVGCRRPEDVNQIAMAGDWTLTSKDLQEIDEIQGDLRLYPRDSDQPRYVRRDS
ncbi:aldo/keto reductase [Dehalococcoidia bacterium]|nr:aldo/keto reductase [Dehalococcoidia bacterium]